MAKPVKKLYEAKSARTGNRAEIDKSCSYVSPWRVRTWSTNGLSGPDALCPTFAAAKRQADYWAKHGKLSGVK